jgi:hypothetical protein
LPKIWRGVKKVFGFITGLFKQTENLPGHVVPVDSENNNQDK